LEHEDILKQFDYETTTDDENKKDQTLVGFIDIANEYISFRLGKELYAVEILRVKEIRSLMEITPVPKMPVYISGVINLRGDIVPVMDLAIKLNFEGVKYGDFSVIIVVEVEKRLIGILAEEVLDVIGIPREKVSDRIDVGSHMQSEFIHGIANIEDKPMMILDIKKLLDLENIEAVK
jgi:purine-binding chemotaxis protein CheW